MGDKTKIEWADATWNPVTGCLHGCEYCYAARAAKRFGGHTSGEAKIIDLNDGMAPRYLLEKPLRNIWSDESETGAPFPFGFAPTFHRYRLGIPERWTKPRTIFVCSVADLFGDWIPYNWIEEVFRACTAAPQHRYLFLTKNPQRYAAMYLLDLMPRQDNYWYGTSVTNEKSKIRFLGKDEWKIHTFWSMEPLLGPVEMDGEKGTPEWIILGAETGNRKGKVKPEKAWIDSITSFCDKNGIPVFMKDSLIPIVGEDNMRRDFPWES